MRRAGHNPTRRNRNIGTAAQGHGANNRLTIPSPPRDCRADWEKLGKTTVVHRDDLNITFLVEETRAGFAHCCSIEDVVRVLRALPQQDWQGISIIVFRQPTHKQATLAGVWARLAFWGDFRVNAETRVSGPAIILEAVERKPWRLARNGADLAEEIVRLRDDGHHIEERRTKVLVRPSAEAIRNTQLFRSLLHEVGHWVHWQQKGDDEYLRIPEREREGFAHGYADRARRALQKVCLIPFAPIPDNVETP